jgi:multisubunit Na+/H+ antiporter MnhB subunit
VEMKYIRSMSKMDNYQIFRIFALITGLVCYITFILYAFITIYNNPDGGLLLAMSGVCFISFMLFFIIFTFAPEKNKREYK